MNRLGRVIVFASDVERLRAFYGAILGEPSEPSEIEPGWVVFEAGLALHAIPPAFAPTSVSPREDTAMKPVFVVDDLAATRAALAALGATMRATQTHGPRTFCDGVDPEGNVFQLADR